MKKGMSIVVCLLSVLFLVNTAFAELQDNLDGTITQTRNDGSMLMWLKDANTAKTTGYHSTGLMSWSEADAWVASLNTSGYLGYSDWRLPDILPINGVSYVDINTYDGTSDLGWNNTSSNSDLSYLFYVELGNNGYWDPDGNGPQENYGLISTGIFDNFQRHEYWAANEYQGPDSHRAFNNNLGYQGAGGNHETIIMFATAVHTVVPEPISSTLFIIGAGVLAGRKYLRRTK